jgi:putative NIF3 family GTP cyclohydrolase 1 type 2
VKAKNLFEILYKAIPDSESWSTGEPYGNQNVDEEAEINRVLYCVTGTPEVEDYFRKGGYDLLISHHPYPVADDIPHAIFHTALDCCEGGLNDMWRDALGVKDAKHFDENLGWHGKIEPIPFNELVDKVKAFAGDVIGQTFSRKDVIETVCICSGLGGLVTSQAATSGADCYIMGEMTTKAETSGFPALIETGHTLSEWIGVRFFEDLLGPLGIEVKGAPLDLDYFGQEHYNNKYKWKYDDETLTEGEDYEDDSDDLDGNDDWRSWNAID